MRKVGDRLGVGGARSRVAGVVGVASAEDLCSDLC